MVWTMSSTSNLTRSCANISCVESDDQEFSVSRVVIPSIYAFVCVVGLTGNSLVIYVILRYAKMKTATNIYILNLAIADECFMLSVPFIATEAALHHWPFSSLVCRLVLSADGINMFTSVFCLTVLSVDRYIAVVHPIKAARYRRPSVARSINVLVWFLSLLVILPIIIFSDTQPSSEKEPERMVCNLVLPHAQWYVVFILYSFVVGFLVPVMAICVCYLLIIVKMRVVAFKAGWQQRRRSERNITRMVITVVFVFILCWMPFYVMQLLDVFGLPPKYTLTQFFVVLSYANSCANPLLYGFLSQNFRRSFQQTFCLRCFNGSFMDEPLDYYATALKSRTMSNKRAIEHQTSANHLRQSSNCRNGTCGSRTTML